ncbi:MAG: hypothetical protein ACPLY7_02055, partial [Microgenomates group bacterium]
HVRLYNEQELREKLENSGFKIEKVLFATHYCFPFSHFLFYGIGKNLVEKGMCQSFNRFGGKSNQSFFKKFFLWPIKEIDKLNTDDNKSSSVNLVFLAGK